MDRGEMLALIEKLRAIGMRLMGGDQHDQREAGIIGEAVAALRASAAPEEGLFYLNADGSQLLMQEAALSQDSRKAEPVALLPVNTRVRQSKVYAGTRDGTVIGATPQSFKVRWDSVTIACDYDATFLTPDVACPIEVLVALTPATEDGKQESISESINAGIEAIACVRRAWEEDCDRCGKVGIGPCAALSPDSRKAEPGTRLNNIIGYLEANCGLEFSRITEVDWTALAALTPATEDGGREKRPSFCATADSVCHHPACTCVDPSPSVGTGTVSSAQRNNGAE